MNGLSRLAECGVVEVRAGGERLPLRVVRLPVQQEREDEAPPLFMLAGGPGQGAVRSFAPLLSALGPVLRGREVILVDQRGSGASAPLDCPSAEPLSAQLEPGALVRIAERCAPRHAERTLSAYGTEEAASDLETVRDALGYEAVDLLGVSYGTRLALAYARRHPDRVRALVLDGVVPPGLRLPLSFARDTERAFDRVAARCRAEPACHEAFPDPAADRRAVMEALGDGTEVEVDHPRTGLPIRFRMTATSFAQLTRGLLYGTELHAMLPLTLSEARAGRFGPLVAQAALIGERAEETMSEGLLLSVICAEDVPRIDRAEVAAATEGTFLGASIVDDFFEACERWPVPTQPLETAPLGADVPVLALSGGADPATPPRWAERALEGLPRAEHVVMDHAGHGIAARGCVPHLVRRFLDAPGEVASLDTGCVEDHEPFPFFVSRAGPPP